MRPALQRVACPGGGVPWGRLGITSDGPLPHSAASRVSDIPVMLPPARAWRACGWRDGVG
jgi:hypothetical protein